MQPMPSTITVVSKDQPADDEYIWKKSEKKTFYAYANVPSDATVALIEKAGGQTMTCTGIPGTDVLMGYYQGEGKTGTGDAAKPTGTASIQFHHPLAAVKVKTGTLAEGVTISSVAIEKVYGKGALMVKQEEDTFTWTRGDEAEFKDENLVESIALTCDGEAEFVIPQTVPSKARIRVTLKEDGVPFNVYSPLSGITWKADTVYTYTIGYNPQPEELLPGKFSISADKYVQFSRGNLQATYHSSSSSYSWAFAANQYDCVGFASGSGNTTIKDDGSNEDGAVVDLFGWTAAGKYSDGMKQYGINKSTSNSDYRVTGDASDECCNWGKAIDGTGSLWCTLSGNKGEWDYLLNDRSNAAQKWGMATIMSVKGAVILPDYWTLPEGCSFTAGKTSSYYEANKYDSDTWAKMEQAGAVFLPAAESREGIIRGETDAVDLCGYYWSQTATSSNNVYRMNFSRGGFPATNSQVPHRGHSVRLVQRFDKPEPPILLPGRFSINSTEYVQFSRGNLQATYDASSSKYTWDFAWRQFDYVGNAPGNTKIGGSQVDGAIVDLFGWSTAKTNYGIATSKTEKDYAGAFVDWSTALDSEPNTWHTLSGGESGEWYYLLKERVVNGGKGEGYSYSNKASSGATIGGITYKGLFIYPDNYSGKAIGEDGAPDTWLDINMAGIVFLPAAGVREVSTVSSAGTRWCYWSSTNHSNGPTYYRAFHIDSNGDDAKKDNQRYFGFSVRLVQKFSK